MSPVIPRRLFAIALASPNWDIKELTTLNLLILAHKDAIEDLSKKEVAKETSSGLSSFAASVLVLSLMAIVAICFVVAIFLSKRKRHDSRYIELK